MKRILIVGAYGFGYMDDECVLQQMLRHVWDANKNTHIGVLSRDPRQTAKYGVEAVPSADILAMLQAVEDCDEVMWMRSEVNADRWALGLEILLVQWAKWRKKRVVGYQPEAREQAGKWVIRQADRLLQRCDRVVRFAITEEDKRVDVDQPDQWDAVPHPLLSARVRKRGGIRHLQDEGIHVGKRPVAFCVDKQLAKTHLEEVAAVADAFVGRGRSILFMPVHHAGDMEAANAILDRMAYGATVMRKMYTALEWVDILGDTATVVTSYMSVQALCRGLAMPHVTLDPHTLDSASPEDLLKTIS